MKLPLLRTITVLFLLAFIAQIPSGKVYACSPFAFPDLKTAQNNADAIFTGKVVAVDDSPFAAISAALSDSEDKRVLFNVTSVWKGTMNADHC